MTARSKRVAQLVRLAGARAGSLGDAFYQIGVIAHFWPTLRPDERRKVRNATLQPLLQP